jgi:hypothetical protein
LQEVDEIAAGAYSYYGYDVVSLAQTRTDNPLTQQELAQYIELDGRAINDPYTGEEVDIYTALVYRIQSGFSSSIYRDVISRVSGLTVDYGMNYERNFLASVFRENPLAVERSYQLLRAGLLEVYHQDPTRFLDALLQLDLTGEFE